MENKIKNGLFIFLFIILLLPVVQQNISFYKSRELFGYFTIAPDIEFTWQKWWKGQYQEGESDYINDHFGFRPEALLVNDQVDYSLFHKYHATWIAPGIDHYLFQTLHINAYYGKDFAGYAPILGKLVKLKALQDTLARLGTSLILAYSPDKACFYPEFFSKNDKRRHKGQTNFDAYRHVGDSLGINQLDFNTWFVRMKNKTSEPLFTKQGIHWSVYGSLLAADSLAGYIEKLRNIHMPHPVWSKIEHTDKARDSDDDLAKTLNLIFPFTTETFSYPEVSYPQDFTMVKPKVIYIGDSFLENWVREGVVDSTNTDWQVWSHFSTIWDKNNAIGKSQLSMAYYDWINAIKNTDCIVIMYTSFNLPELGEGFIEKAYDHFYPKK